MRSGLAEMMLAQARGSAEGTEDPSRTVIGDA